MVRSSFEVADFFIDEPNFLRNMRIFKKKSAKYRGKSALPNLMCSTLLRLCTANMRDVFFDQNAQQYALLEKIRGAHRSKHTSRLSFGAFLFWRAESYALYSSKSERLRSTVFLPRHAKARSESTSSLIFSRIFSVKWGMRSSLKKENGETWGSLLYGQTL